MLFGAFVWASKLRASRTVACQRGWLKPPTNSCGVTVKSPHWVLNRSHSGSKTTGWSNPKPPAEGAAEKFGAEEVLPLAQGQFLAHMPTSSAREHARRKSALLNGPGDGTDQNRRKAGQEEGNKQVAGNHCTRKPRRSSAASVRLAAKKVRWTSVLSVALAPGTSTAATSIARLSFCSAPRCAICARCGVSLLCSHVHRQPRLGPP